MTGDLDILLSVASQTPVVGLFVWFVLKTKKMHAEERMEVQRNFKEFLTPHSEAMTSTQLQVAEVLRTLAKEVHTMAAQNQVEHNEIIARLRRGN